MKLQQKDTFKHYDYPEEVLNYIRVLVLKAIKGEISEDSEKLSLIVIFGRFIGKSLQQIFLF